MNRDFRNYLAHYGLGQYMKESDILQRTVDQIEEIVLEKER